MHSKASGFSIFAITLALPPVLEIRCLRSIISCAERTNDSPIQSTSCSMANARSFSSFSVKLGKDILVFGKLTPFFEDKTPPCFTLQTICFLRSVETTSSISFPSSSKINSPLLTSAGSLL